MTQYSVSIDGEVIIPWGQIPPIRNLAETATSGDKTYQSTIWQEPPFSQTTCKKTPPIKPHEEAVIRQTTNRNRH